MTRRHPLTDAEIKQQAGIIKRFKPAFDLLDVHVHITDANGVIIYANLACSRITGFTLDEIIGSNAGDLWGGNEPREFYQQMWQAIKIEKRSFTAVVNNHRKDESKLKQQIHITPIVDRLNDAKFFCQPAD